MGSTGWSVRYSSMSAPAPAKVDRRMSVMVRTLGPVSIRNPSASRTPARPPGTSSRSRTITSWPLPVRWQAADNPPNPAPTTATLMVRAACPPSPVAPGHVVREVGQGEAGVGNDGGVLQGEDRGGDEVVDGLLHLLHRTRLHQQLLQLGHLLVVEVRSTVAVEEAGRGTVRPVSGDGEQDGRLAVPQVLADRLARHRLVAVGAEQ